MNVADYQSRQYPNPPCWALVADVYQGERGEGVAEFRTVNHSVRAIASAFRVALHKGQHGFEQLDAPAELCIVLLARSETLGFHHCGVYCEGKVLHATESGVFHQDLASLGDWYPVMQFWGRP